MMTVTIQFELVRSDGEPIPYNSELYREAAMILAKRAAETDIAWWLPTEARRELAERPRLVINSLTILNPQTDAAEKIGGNTFDPPPPVRPAR
jgi:hypothetical protein